MKAEREDPPSPTTADWLPESAVETSAPALPALANGSRLAGRYRIVRFLGQGAMGVVYEAVDEQRSGLRVALKLLIEHQPTALYRLKNEFRALVETVHPNLVGLHGLGVDALGWFIVMDLIDPSVDFLSYVREAATATLHEQRLRAVLVQLLRGISAIHGAGKLHRDLKPRNVLVTGEGRVVIVDFGLVGDLEQGSAAAGRETGFAGTPAYAAPEQMLGGALGPKADLYAVGVMLYEALTGSLPVDGASAERLLEGKLRAAPPLPSALARGVPADLEALCTALLEPEPALRLDAQQVLQQLGEQAPLVPEATSALPFVARDAELQLLCAAAAHARESPGVVVVSGPSGIGKTALIARFLERVPRQLGALGVRGRCHPHEQLPFKAFDNLVDELGQQLMRMPPQELASLLPRDIGLVSLLFPTLARVPAVRLLAAGGDATTDRTLLRLRAFAALKELLARMAERGALVLTFDDLQWSDSDSSELLRELLREPGAPACLFVCVFRESQPGENALAALLRVLPASTALRLGPLDQRSSVALADSLLGSSRVITDLELVVDEAGGNPFLLKELSRHARAWGRVEPLRETVAARFLQLDTDARRLLELVCIAGQPLELGTALRAAAVEPRALPAVLASSLLRTSVQQGRECLESQHDRIREAVVASLEPARRAWLHGELARELAHGAGQALDLIAHHYYASGQPLLATGYALAAARRATHALAFGHAAHLYELAIEHAKAADVPEIELALADVYAKIGRVSDAADRYERALASFASPAQRTELAGKAMLLHLLQGNIERGARLLDVLCKELGVAGLPRPRLLAKLAIMALYLRHKLGRGVASMPVPRQHRHTASSQDRLELCMRAARGFAHWSLEHTLYFGLQSVLLTRRHRDPKHWPYAILWEVGARTVFRGISTEQDEREMDVAIALAEREDDPEVLAYILAMEGARRIYTGHFSRATDLLERAEQVLSTRGRSIAPVANSVHSGLCAMWIVTGRLDLLLARSDAWLTEARALGDRWGEQTVRLTGSYRFLALDQPELMREAVADLVSGAGRDAPPLAGHPVWAIEPMLYLGQAEQALATHGAARRARPFAAMQLAAFDRIGCSLLWIRTCLAAALVNPQQRATRLRLVEREVRRVQRERFITVSPIVAQARAGLAIQRGDRHGALRELERAAQGYAAAGLELYAAATRARAGKLEQGARGAERVAQAHSQATALGVRNPERMFRALVTGFPD